MSEKFLDKVRTAHAFELGYETVTLGRVVPEKELALGLLVAVGTGGIDRLHGIGVDSRVEYLSAQGHGSGCKVLNLLQTEVELLCLYGEFSHIDLGTAGMAAYEIGYELLTQSVLLVYSVK